jgi:hypothetical protein
LRYDSDQMQPHRVATQVHKGVVTVTGVTAAEGEVVEVIVIRGTDDASRYAAAPVAEGEMTDVDDPLGWEADGWDEFANEAR